MDSPTPKNRLQVLGRAAPAPAHTARFHRQSLKQRQTVNRRGSVLAGLLLAVIPPPGGNLAKLTLQRCKFAVPVPSHALTL